MHCRIYVTPSFTYIKVYVFNCFLVASFINCAMQQKGVKYFQQPGVVELGCRLASFYPNIQVDNRSGMNLVTSSIFVSLVCCSFT